jgi:CheY-like chemotaxis protein
MTILVVDDNQELAENLVEILASTGRDAISVGSAEEALERIQRTPFNALITDYRLPGLNGAQLIRELRKAGKALPAAVISAYMDEPMLAAAQSVGAVGIFPKPIDIDHLLKLVDRLDSDALTVQKN